MLLELAIFTGRAVVSSLHFTELVKQETRLCKYPTHVFSEGSFIQPEISEYYFMNRILFRTVSNESLTLKRTKTQGKREGAGPCVKAEMDQNHFNILLNSLLFEIVLRKMLYWFITCKRCCGITELLRLAGSSGDPLVLSPAQVGSPRASCLGLCPGKFLISQRGGNSTAALDNFCQCSVTLIVNRKQVFPDLHVVLPMFQFVLFASCPITGCH